MESDTITHTRLNYANKVYLCGILLMCTISLYGQYYNPYYNSYQQSYQQMQQQAQQWAEDYCKNWMQQNQNKVQETQQWAENFTKNWMKENGESSANLFKKMGSYEHALKDYTLHIEEYGSASAMYEVAEMYEFGLGVTRDTQKAKYWYKRAYDNGLSLAYQGLHSIEQNFYGKNTPQALYSGL